MNKPTSYCILDTEALGVIDPAVEDLLSQQISRACRRVAERAFLRNMYKPVPWSQRSSCFLVSLDGVQSGETSLVNRGLRARQKPPRLIHRSTTANGEDGRCVRGHRGAARVRSSRPESRSHSCRKGSACIQSGAVPLAVDVHLAVFAPELGAPTQAYRCTRHSARIRGASVIVTNLNALCAAWRIIIPPSLVWSGSSSRRLVCMSPPLAQCTMRQPCSAPG